MLQQTSPPSYMSLQQEGPWAQSSSAQHMNGVISLARQHSCRCGATFSSSDVQALIRSVVRMGVQVELVNEMGQWSGAMALTQPNRIHRVPRCASPFVNETAQSAGSAKHAH